MAQQLIGPDGVQIKVLEDEAVQLWSDKDGIGRIQYQAEPVLIACRTSYHRNQSFVVEGIAFHAEDQSEVSSSKTAKHND